jgi:hypothetical protein
MSGLRISVQPVIGLSPGIDLDGETFVHCAVCFDTGKVTPEQAEAWELRDGRTARVMISALPCTFSMVPHPNRKFGDALSTSPQAGSSIRSQSLWTLWACAAEARKEFKRN